MFRLLMPEEVWALPPEQLAIELLVMYEEAGFDYERFCAWLDLDPEDDEVFEWADMIHKQWAESARVLGWDEHDKVLNTRRSVPQ